MKIGRFVQALLPEIIEYCEQKSHNEFGRLCDADYSKRNFNLNFPFLVPIISIPSDLSKRYWTQVYMVRGQTVRACSQWFEKDAAYFVKYLKRIGVDYDLFKLESELLESRTKPLHELSATPARANSRYRGNAIGNAQNLLVRNILSNLGTEQFSEEDWQATKSYFNHQCAYCGRSKELVIEHAIPINKVYLGEHRLGNLVPSCRECNSAKASKDFRDFLEGHDEKIAAIEAYMEEKNYVPLENNEQVSRILEMAYREVGTVLSDI
ncbi:hypothetical protein JCM19240_3964 [Vibrio maritimus]|uniref:HNH nuclease domain-containing protein n=1 Tax=Vibrio maritimus TaxID=990268 RepID=A0A090TCK3_9VIBR|nr:hypothetical protein JCM19240_3964 [Vibrio maritimus]